jgi:hypothetical protein
MLRETFPGPTFPAWTLGSALLLWGGIVLQCQLRAEQLRSSQVTCNADTCVTHATRRGPQLLPLSSIFGAALRTQPTPCRSLTRSTLSTAVAAAATVAAISCSRYGCWYYHHQLLLPTPHVACGEALSAAATAPSRHHVQQPQHVWRCCFPENVEAAELWVEKQASRQAHPTLAGPPQSTPCLWHRRPTLDI